MPVDHDVFPVRPAGLSTALDRSLIADESAEFGKNQSLFC
ncbi:hypothetical protein ABI_05940 [Asticcacaulis biprosthecium C19]|uniref:Uncharacterized protein n=1 Tax=Asticcacaulis biprosthecium C19 TaxID=715226 RepID=F4QKK8_9CAUL|nr:hypothetical protein ABI_05940 [Asticcacaulis biprosthecium C19]